MTSTIPSAALTGPNPSLPTDVASARAAGRQLAQDVAAPLAPTGRASVEAMVRAGLPRLPQVDLRAELVRSRPNCVVVRSTARHPDQGERSCALVTAWLESLPWIAHRALGTVVESSCLTRGGTACIHTLLWQGASTASPDADPAGAAGGAVGGVPASGAPDEAATTTSVTLAPVPPPPHAIEPGDPARQDEEQPPGAGLTPYPDSWVGKANVAFRSIGAAARALGTGRDGGGRDGGGRDGSGRPTAGGIGTGDVAPAGGAGAREPAAQEPSGEAGPDGTGRTNGAKGTPGSRGAAASGGGSATGAAPGSTQVVAMAGSRVVETVEPVQAPGGATGAPASRPARGKGRRWAWVRRRAWLLAIGMVAGSAGGYLAGAHHATSYSATAVLVVRSGASPTGPGGANDAEALAVTDAALLPSDEAVVGQVAGQLHLPVSTVSRDMVAQAVAGTSLIRVRFTSSSPSVAVAGANAVAGAVAGPRPTDQAIASGSVAEVSQAKSAARSGSLYKYALPLGAILGLLLGAVAALAAERADRRVDEADGLHEATGCPVTVVPGGVSPTELARALERATGGNGVTLVPLRRTQAPAAQQLARELRGSAAAGRPAATGIRGPVTVTLPFADAPDAAGDREGPTVLVVGAGERLRVVHEVTGRLRLLDRAPVWSVFVVPS